MASKIKFQAKPSYKEGAKYKVKRSYTGYIDGSVRSFTQGRCYKLSKGEWEVLSAAGEVEAAEV